jgi:predicted RNA-binding Zn ribbon-like protein
MAVPYTCEEQFLLELLNSTSAPDGSPADLFDDQSKASRWQTSRGGTGAKPEAVELRYVRGMLHQVIRGEQQHSVLTPALRNVTQTPTLTEAGIRWSLQVNKSRELAVRAIIAWATVQEHTPGRLRACANPDCGRYLLDRSQANNARWCSMDTCGNRMKARRHEESKTKTLRR